MIASAHSIRFAVPISIALLLLDGSVVLADQAGEGHPRLVEVFTTTASSVTSEAVLDTEPGYRVIEFRVYVLDGIQRLETRLSQGLTADPEHSRQIVLQRFQQLYEEDRAQLQGSAMGLAKAMQYGIDRYPTIVFDGKYVVYGVTNVREALQQYRKWREDRHQ